MIPQRALYLIYIMIQLPLQANIFSEIKSAFESAVSSVSGAQANQKAQQQTNYIIGQYEQALKAEKAAILQEQQVIQQEQQALEQEEQVIAKQQIALDQCIFEKTLILQLQPYAPPANDPEVYKLLVLTSILQFLQRNPTMLSKIFAIYQTSDQLVILAKTLTKLTSDDVSKITQAYTSAQQYLQQYQQQQLQEQQIATAAQQALTENTSFNF